MYTACLPRWVHVFSERVEGVRAPALRGAAPHREADRLICVYNMYVCVRVCVCVGGWVRVWASVLNGSIDLWSPPIYLFTGHLVQQRQR